MIFRISLKPSIARKYGLVDDKLFSAQGISDLALHVARMLQAATASGIQGALSQRHLYAANAMANLLQSRSADLEETGTFQISAKPASSDFPDFVSSDSTCNFSGYDWPGLIAYLSALHVVLRVSFSVEQDISGNLVLRLPSTTPDAIIETNILKVIQFWAALSPVRTQEGLCLIPQTLN